MQLPTNPKPGLFNQSGQGLTATPTSSLTPSVTPFVTAAPVPALTAERVQFQDQAAVGVDPINQSGQGLTATPSGAPSGGPFVTPVRSPALTVQRVQFQDQSAVEAHSKTKEKKGNPKIISYSAKLLAQSIKGEYEYAKLGLILGVLTIVGGTILSLYGVVGNTSWTAKILGFESKLGDAAPGVVLFVAGIFFIRLTKPKVNLKDLKG